VRPAHATAPGLGVGVCPYANAFLQEVSVPGNGAAVVFTTTCDQMRRISERMDPGQPVFVMHVPTTWQTTAAQRLYRDELLRLGRFLEGLGGRPPSPERLADTMIAFDEARAKLRDARGALSPRQFSEAIAHFHHTGQVSLPANATPASSPGVPLALAGGPMMSHHFDLFDLIEQHGGAIVLDATTTGERSLPPPFDRRALRDDPIGELAGAYFGHIPDAFRRPNSRLYTWLRDAVAERGIRGIILRHYLWCDTWHAEVQRMREWDLVPVLALHAEQDESLGIRTTARLQAFLEMLL